jgi:RimJ/RimL family protein N-acetyltransferase
MQLTIITRKECELVRQWRNENIQVYRTPFLFTPEMQENFYDNTICNRQSNSRYWAVKDGDIAVFIGMVGLCNISLENRNAEISIVIDPELRGTGHGEKALLHLLNKGFNELNLDNIYGESYRCNPDIGFWEAMIDKFEAYSVDLKNNKFHDGQYWDSLWFNFTRQDYKNYWRK